MTLTQDELEQTVQDDLDIEAGYPETAAAAIRRQVALGIREGVTFKFAIEILLGVDTAFQGKLRFCLYPATTIPVTPVFSGLAERVGFEPTVGFLLHTLSKRAP